MYTVDLSTNRMNPVTIRRFSDLGLTERHHLQEWLAHEPSALGEELLIIQKEFDGFDDTRERLDLLAIDKNGNLVLIENKLDDSGRDVVWQAIKYASYCATLTKQQIINIYQRYIDKYLPSSSNDQQDQNAGILIAEFLDKAGQEGIEEIKLNSGFGQRIILVAANFRKEVTSTAIWLRENGIDIECFKVTPYMLGEQLLISIDQIIPPPETRDLMISMNAKEADEKNADKIEQKRHSVRQAYWTQLLERFKGSSCSLYNNISASKDHWLSAGSGVSSCPYTLIFSQKLMRVELKFGRGSAEENKLIFDHLYQHKAQIEAQFGAELNWRRLDDNVSSMVEYEIPADGYQQELWPQWIEWHLKHITQLEKAFKPLLSQAADAAKKQLIPAQSSQPSFAQAQ